jgi:hypothetical protein
MKRTFASNGTVSSQRHFFVPPREEEQTAMLAAVGDREMMML